jgi:hypothetical protein
VFEDDLGVNEVGHGVLPVLLDPIQHHLRLLGSQEPVLVREVGDEEPEHDSKGDSKQAFEEEDPLPAVEAACGGDLLEPVREDGAEAAEDDRDVVEDG